MQRERLWHIQWQDRQLLARLEVEQIPACDRWMHFNDEATTLAAA